MASTNESDCPPESLVELQGRYIQVPVPERPKHQGQLEAVLDGLPIRWAVDISKGLGATKARVYRYRRRKGGEFCDSGVEPGLVPGVANRLMTLAAPSATGPLRGSLIKTTQPASTGGPCGLTISASDY